MRQRIRLREVDQSVSRVWGVCENIYVGNSDGLQIRLSDPSVSRNHALIRWTGGRWVVRDMNSAHGTFVNGDRLENAERVESVERVLRASDRIRFGNLVVVVESVGFGPMLFDDTWDSCDDPTDMIDCWAGRATTRRKWRLLALACLRRL